MSISDLTAVVPPPESPDESGSHQEFRQIEQKMGVTLPTDYRELTIRYGSGWFLDGYLSFANPFVLDLVANNEALGRCQYNYEWGSVPWPPYPAEPGLLGIGGNENGNDVHFLVDGEPDSWPIIVVAHGAGRNEFERWDVPLGTFLANALLNKFETAAVHACNEPVEPYERVFKQHSDVWGYRAGKWVPKRKRRK